MKFLDKSKNKKRFFRLFFPFYYAHSASFIKFPPFLSRERGRGGLHILNCDRTMIFIIQKISRKWRVGNYEVYDSIIESFRSSASHSVPSYFKQILGSIVRYFDRKFSNKQNFEYKILHTFLKNVSIWIFRIWAGKVEIVDFQQLFDLLFVDFQQLIKYEKCFLSKLAWQKSWIRPW